MPSKLSHCVYSLCSPLKGWGFRLGLVLAAVLILGGCQKKCQAPPEKPFETFVEQQWRVVESTNPVIGNDIDNYNFYIFYFGRDFEGTVSKVESNKPIETPVLTFSYDVDPKTKRLLIEYHPLSGGDIQTQYIYNLGRDFEIDEKGGNQEYFRMVPFLGVVDPDKDCTF